MLVWDDKFETGQPALDAQHRMLIAYINRLGVMALNQKPNREDIAHFHFFVEFMEEYISNHFHGEEESMLRLKCPAHFENCQAHQHFLTYFRNFKLRMMQSEGEYVALMRELNETCEAWIKSHILQIDTQMKNCPFDSELGNAEV